MKYTQVLILLDCKYGGELYYLLIIYCIHQMQTPNQVSKLMKMILFWNLVLEPVWRVLSLVWFQAKLWAQVIIENIQWKR